VREQERERERERERGTDGCGKGIIDLKSTSPVTSSRVKSLKLYQVA